MLHVFRPLLPGGAFLVLISICDVYGGYVDSDRGQSPLEIGFRNVPAVEPKLR